MSFTERVASKLWLLVAAWLVCSQSVAVAAEDGAARALYLEAVRPAISLGTSAEMQRQVVLLKAATQIDPTFLPAYVRLASVAMQVNRPDLVQSACRSYLSKKGDSALMQLQLVDIELESLQTVEARRAYLLQFLNEKSAKDLLPEVASDIYRRLAELAWQTYDEKQARRYLQMALSQADQNLKAQQLLTHLVMSDSASTPAEKYQRQVEAVLATLAANPLDSQPYQQIAVLAGTCGLADEFNRWDKAWHKLLLLGNIRTQHTPDVQEHLALAEAALDAGLYARAKEILSEAISLTTTAPSTRADTQPAASTVPTEIPATVEARIRATLAIAAGKLNEPELLQKQSAWFERIYNDMLTEHPPEADVAAIAGIYFSVYGRNLDNAAIKAVKLANFAHRDLKTPSDLTRLALALTLAKTGDAVQSRKLIDELSNPNEPLASLAVVWAQITSSQPDQARRTLETVLAKTTPSPVRDELVEIWHTLTEQPAPAPNLDEVKLTLEEFNQEYLRLPLDPGAFYDVKVRTLGDLDQGETVRIELTLSNLGPLVLSIGPGCFIEPVALARVSADDQSDGAIVQVPLDARQLLRPGEKMTAWAFLEQAQPAQLTTTRPQVADDRLRSWPAILLAASGKSLKVHTSVGGLDSNVAELAVPPIDRSFAEKIMSKLGAPDAVSWTWADQASWVLQNPQQSDVADLLTARMVNALNPLGGDRAVPLECALRYAPPNAAVLNALAGKLTNPNWLCRLVAIDSIAALQGERARSIYEDFAKKDSDPLVRQLAVANLLAGQSEKKESSHE
jgi:hypothetical protein